MRFGIVDPRAARAEVVDLPNAAAAAKLAGLDVNYVDHGTLRRDHSGGVGFFADRFALWVPRERQRYSSIGRQLIAGAAIIYAFDGEGQTIDLTNMPGVVFYGSADEVEKMISAGVVNRPAITIDGEQIWAWPEWPDTENVIDRVRAGEEI